MDVNDVFGTINFAVEAGYAVFTKFDHRKEPVLYEAGYGSRRRHLGHVDDVCRANDIANSATSTALKINAFDHT